MFGALFLAKLRMEHWRERDENSSEAVSIRRSTIAWIVAAVVVVRFVLSSAEEDQVVNLI